MQKWTRAFAKLVLLSLLLSTTAVAKRVKYKIEFEHDEPGTKHEIVCTLHGWDGKVTDWFVVKGHHDAGIEEHNYVFEEMQDIAAITLEVRHKAWVSPFHPASWKPISVTVKAPWPNDNSRYTEYFFVLGDEFRYPEPGKQGDKRTYFEPQVSGAPPVAVSPTGKIKESQNEVVVVNFHDNPTSTEIDVFKSTETWERSDSVGISSEVSSESSTGVGVSYSSPETVAGQFGVSLDQSWSRALSNAREEVRESGYSSTQDWSYKVAPWRAKFRKLVLRVPTKYSLWATSNGKHRWIRQPGGKVINTGTGSQLEIPSKTEGGELIPVPWATIQNDYLAYMDESNRASVMRLKSKWLSQGWVYEGSRPVANSSAVNQNSGNTSTTSHSHGVRGIYGWYSIDSPKNDWQRGKIAPDSAGKMFWTNKADISWSLTPNLAQQKLDIGPDGIYNDDPTRREFKLVRDANQKITGFQFGPEFYRRVANIELSLSQELAGTYHRAPVQNDYHKGKIVAQDGKLTWQNAAGKSWALIETGDRNKLDTGSQNTYRHEPNGRYFEVIWDSSGGVIGFRFNGEVYQRQ
jgi:hypothetical protein